MDELKKRQALADRARQLREGVPAQPETLESRFDPRNPQRVAANDDETQPKPTKE